MWTPRPYTSKATHPDPVVSIDELRLDAEARRGGHGSTWSRLWPGLLSLGALLGGWQLLTASGAVAPLILPPPVEVARAGSEFAGPITEAALVTLAEVLLGFAAAVAAGFAVALPISYSRRLRAAIYPPLLLLNALPKAALAPIFLIWFGFGLTHKVVVAFLVAFFPIVVALNAGLKRVDPELHDLSRSLHASWLQTFLKIDLPFALPSLFSGMRVAITLAVVGAVIAEFVAGDGGIAHLLRSAGAQHQTALSFACAATLSFLSAALFGLVVLAEYLAVPWARRNS